MAGSGILPPNLTRRNLNLVFILKEIFEFWSLPIRNFQSTAAKAGV